MGVRELPYPVILTLEDIHRPFVGSPIRRLNYRFGLAEACWILSGSNDAQLIGSFNKNMLNFSDDGHTMWGAYGPRLMGQMDHVLSSLRRDPDSRQAVSLSWRPMVSYVNASSDCWNNGPAGRSILERAGIHSESMYAISEKRPEWDGSSWRSKDVPCTICWHFLLRHGRLNLTVFMRSNDVWLGLPYDLLSFTTVLRTIASALGVQPGRYNHVASNLHMYDGNLDAAMELMNERSMDVPEITKFDRYFDGLSADQIKTVFHDVISMNDVRCFYDNPLSPFYAAICRKPELWDGYADLQRANGRGRVDVP